MKTFDMHEAVNRTGATLRQIDHLVSAGLVTPAEAAPRRGMSRKFTLDSLRYIAVAARLLSWGVGVEDFSEIKAMIGTDQPMNRFLARFNHSFIGHIWNKLQDPEQCARFEFLLLFRIVDPATKRTLLYQQFFATAESLASAARTGIDCIVISMKELAKQVDAVDEGV